MKAALCFGRDVVRVFRKSDSDQIRNAGTLSRRASSDCAFYGFTPAANKISAAVPKLLEFHPGRATDLIGHFRCKLIALLWTL